MSTTTRAVQSDPPDVLEAVRSRHRIECRQTRQERRALETFADRVRAIPPDPVGQDTAPPGVRNAETGTTAVRDAYESTVMGVPHYEAEYGDTYAESVREEFGPTVGVALVESSQFTEPLRQTLLVAVDRARAERALLLAALDAERQSIAEVSRTLSPVIEDLTIYECTAFEKESFGALDGYRARLSVLLDRCDEAAQQRQAAIRDQRRDLQLPSDAPDVPTYMYRDLPANYPVLALIASLGERIDGVYGKLGTAIANTS